MLRARLWPPRVGLSMLIYASSLSGLSVGTKAALLMMQAVAGLSTEAVRLHVNGAASAGGQAHKADRQGLCRCRAVVVSWKQCYGRCVEV